MASNAASKSSTVPVWDRIVRAGHWLLAFSVLGGWLTRHTLGPWHEWLGYASLVTIAVRLAWGWCGSHYARFANFVRGPGPTLRYALAMLARREPAMLGHNPLGALAYMSWHVFDDLTMTVGKMRQPFFRPGFSGFFDNEIRTRRIGFAATMVGRLPSLAE